jgi:hypothetical protein
MEKPNYLFQKKIKLGLIIIFNLLEIFQLFVFIVKSYRRLEGS